MAPPWQMPKPRRRLPGGLTGNALLTALIATVVAGLISFGITSYQDRDAASQAHAAQVADGASQVESAAVAFYNAAESLYTARRQCARQEHPGGTVPPGCPPRESALLDAEAVIGAAYANTSDQQTSSLMAVFTDETLGELSQAADPRAPEFPAKMTKAYYALVARCGQLIQGR